MFAQPRTVTAVWMTDTQNMPAEYCVRYTSRRVHINSESTSVYRRRRASFAIRAETRGCDPPIHCLFHFLPSTCHIYRKLRITLLLSCSTTFFLKFFPGFRWSLIGDLFLQFLTFYSLLHDSICYSQILKIFCAHFNNFVIDYHANMWLWF